MKPPKQTVQCVCALQLQWKTRPIEHTHHWRGVRIKKAQDLNLPIHYHNKGWHTVQTESLVGWGSQFWLDSVVVDIIKLKYFCTHSNKLMFSI